MKKIFMFVYLFLAIGTTGFAENLVFENGTSFPSDGSKMVIQWATSAKEVDHENKSLIYGNTLASDSLQEVKQTGKVTVEIPRKAEHFRVVVWSKKDGEPDLVTNWVDAVPNKTYSLDDNHLVPVVLMSGTGC